MQEYQVVAKKTNELSEKEWTEFTSAFNFVFKKQYTTDHFKTKYFGSSFGYSLHGILFYDNLVVGMFTAIPRQYNFKGQEITIALGCDAFILKEHRKDEFFLKQMADVVTTSLENAGVSHFISIPNKTAYPYWKYYGGWKDIGQLSYYIVPLRVSKIVGKFKIADFISVTIFKLIFSFTNIYHSKSDNIINTKPISLNFNEDMLSQRYRKDYIIKELPGNGKFIYRIYNEDNVRTAYLIDCFPKSKSNFNLALNQIIKDNGKCIDLIMYVGKIDHPPFFFLKVPIKYEPRKQPFIGLCLNETDCNYFYTIDNWDVSLANFDNR